MTKPDPELPHDMKTYLAGVPEESDQFDFFIGEWDCETTRFSPFTGKIESRYPGKWIAEYLHDRRVVFDRFIRYTPDGEEAGVGIQVRTFSPATGQWEMAQIDVHQPRSFSRFSARWEDGEMKLHADCDGWTFRGRFFDIGQEAWKWEGDAGKDGKWARMIEVVAQRSSGN